MVTYKLHVTLNLREKEREREALDCNVEFPRKEIPLGQINQELTDGLMHGGKKFGIILYK